MKIETVTTITTSLDVETAEAKHDVVVTPEAGIPESVARASAIGGCRSALHALGVNDVTAEKHQKTKDACKELGRQLERFIEDTFRWAGMEDQIGQDDPDQQLAWEICAEMPDTIKELTRERDEALAKLAKVREWAETRKGWVDHHSAVMQHVGDAANDVLAILDADLTPESSKTPIAEWAESTGKSIAEGLEQMHDAIAPTPECQGCVPGMESDPECPEHGKTPAPVEAEGGVLKSPRWPDGCRLTLNELARTGEGHIDCRKTAPVEAGEREALARIIAWAEDGEDPDVEWDSLSPGWKKLYLSNADAILAAGFRRIETKEK